MTYSGTSARYFAGTALKSRVEKIGCVARSVKWRLSMRKGGYKVVDAKVLGFSLVYMQRGLFTSYISKRNGDVAMLVTALNR